MPVRSAAGLTGQAFFLGDRRKGKWVGYFVGFPLVVLAREKWRFPENALYGL
jgi:hypothetical protein